MFTTTILFSVLAVMVKAAPLPMPAAKMSHKLASRFYSSEPILYDGTPCWNNGYEGVLQNDVCVLAALEIGSDGYAHSVPVLSGTPCTLNGQQGIWQDTTCVLADVDVNAKRGLLSSGSLLPGDACYYNNRPGVWRNGLCDILDANLDVDTIGQGYSNGAVIPGTNNLIPGAPCWQNGRQGFWQSDLCILADLDVAKRYITNGGEGLVGGLVDTLTGDRYVSPYVPYGAPSSNVISADAEALVDAGSNRFYERNGLLHHAPSGDVVDSASKSVSQLLDHVVEKRNLLGLSPNRNQNGDLIAEIEATANLDLDTGDEPYYGPGGLKIVPLVKKGLLGLGSSNNNGLLGLGSSHNGLLDSAYPSNDLVADVTASLGVDVTNASPSFVNGYPSNREVLGDLLPTHGSGLLKRDLAGLTSGSGPTKNLLSPLLGSTSNNGLPIVGDMLKSSSSSSTNSLKQSGLGGIL